MSTISTIPQPVSEALAEVGRRVFDEYPANSHEAELLMQRCQLELLIAQEGMENRDVAGEIMHEIYDLELEIHERHKFPWRYTLEWTFPGEWDLQFPSTGELESRIREAEIRLRNAEAEDDALRERLGYLSVEEAEARLRLATVIWLEHNRDFARYVRLPDQVDDPRRWHLCANHAG